MEKRISSLGILWFFFRQYKRKVAILVASSLIVGGLEAASVAVVYPILSAAFEGGIDGGNIIQEHK